MQKDDCDEQGECGCGRESRTKYNSRSFCLGKKTLLVRHQHYLVVSNLLWLSVLGHGLLRVPASMWHYQLLEAPQ